MSAKDDFAIEDSISGLKTLLEERLPPDAFQKWTHSLKTKDFIGQQHDFKNVRDSRGVGKAVGEIANEMRQGSRTDVALHRDLKRACKKIDHPKGDKKISKVAAALFSSDAFRIQFLVNSWKTLTVYQDSLIKHLESHNAPKSVRQEWPLKLLLECTEIHKRTTWLEEFVSKVRELNESLKVATEQKKAAATQKATRDPAVSGHKSRPEFPNPGEKNLRQNDEILKILQKVVLAAIDADSTCAERPLKKFIQYLSKKQLITSELCDRLSISTLPPKDVVNAIFSGMMKLELERGWKDNFASAFDRLSGENIDVVRILLDKKCNQNTLYVAKYWDELEEKYRDKLGKQYTSREKWPFTLIRNSKQDGGYSIEKVAKEIQRNSKSRSEREDKTDDKQQQRSKKRKAPDVPKRANETLKEECFKCVAALGLGSERDKSKKMLLLMQKIFYREEIMSKSRELTRGQFTMNSEKVMSEIFTRLKTTKKSIVGILLKACLNEDFPFDTVWTILLKAILDGEHDDSMKWIVDNYAILYETQSIQKAIKIGNDEKWRNDSIKLKKKQNPPGDILRLFVEFAKQCMEPKEKIPEIELTPQTGQKFVHPGEDESVIECFSIIACQGIYDKPDLAQTFVAKLAENGFISKSTAKKAEDRLIQETSNVKKVMLKVHQSLQSHWKNDDDEWKITLTADFASKKGINFDADLRKSLALVLRAENIESQTLILFRNLEILDKEKDLIKSIANRHLPSSVDVDSKFWKSGILSFCAQKAAMPEVKKFMKELCALPVVKAKMASLHGKIETEVQELEEKPEEHTSTAAITLKPPQGTKKKTSRSVRSTSPRSGSHHPEPPESTSRKSDKYNLRSRNQEQKPSPRPRSKFLSTQSNTTRQYEDNITAKFPESAASYSPGENAGSEQTLSSSKTLPDSGGIVLGVSYKAIPEHDITKENQASDLDSLVSKPVVSPRRRNKGKWASLKSDSENNDNTGKGDHDTVKSTDARKSAPEDNDDSQTISKDEDPSKTDNSDEHDSSQTDTDSDREKEKPENKVACDLPASSASQSAESDTSSEEDEPPAKHQESGTESPESTDSDASSEEQQTSDHETHSDSDDSDDSDASSLKKHGVNMKAVQFQKSSSSWSSTDESPIEKNDDSDKSSSSDTDGAGDQKRNAGSPHKTLHDDKKEKEHRSEMSSSSDSSSNYHDTVATVDKTLKPATAKMQGENGRSSDPRTGNKHHPAAEIAHEVNRDEVSAEGPRNALFFVYVDGPDDALVSNVSIRTSLTNWKTDHTLEKLDGTSRVFYGTVGKTNSDSKTKDLEYKYTIDNCWERLPGRPPTNRLKRKGQLRRQKVTFFDVASVKNLPGNGWINFVLNEVKHLFTSVRGGTENIEAWLQQMYSGWLLTNAQHLVPQDVIESTLCSVYSKNMEKSEDFMRNLIYSLTILRWLKDQKKKIADPLLLKYICRSLSIHGTNDKEVLDYIKKELKNITKYDLAEHTIPYLIKNSPIMETPEWILVLPLFTLLKKINEPKEWHLHVQLDRICSQEDAINQAGDTFSEAVAMLVGTRPWIAKYYRQVSHPQDFYNGMVKHTGIQKAVEYYAATSKLLLGCSKAIMKLENLGPLTNYFVKGWKSYFEKNRKGVTVLFNQYISCLKKLSQEDVGDESYLFVCTILSSFEHSFGGTPQACENYRGVYEQLEVLLVIVGKRIKNYPGEWHGIQFWSTLARFHWSCEFFNDMWERTITDKIHEELQKKCLNREEKFLKFYWSTYKQDKQAIHDKTAEIVRQTFFNCFKTMISRHSGYGARAKNWISSMGYGFGLVGNDEIGEIFFEYINMTLQKYTHTYEFVCLSEDAPNFAEIYQLGLIPNHKHQTVQRIIGEIKEFSNFLEKGQLTLEVFCFLNEHRKQFIQFFTVARLVYAEDALFTIFENQEMRYRMILHRQNLIKNFTRQCKEIVTGEIIISDLQKLQNIADKELRPCTIEQAEGTLQFDTVPWREISAMHELGDNAFFRTAWKLIAPEYYGKQLQWREIIEKIWKDVENELLEVLDVIDRGTITVEKITEALQRNSKDMVVKNVAELYCLGKTTCQDRHWKQGIRIKQIVACIDTQMGSMIAEFFTKLKDFHNLKGEFDEMKKYQRMENEKQLKDVEDIEGDEKFLTVSKHIAGLKSFIEQGEFIVWLRTKMKDLGDLRTFCDLAVRNTNGIPYEVDKISCLTVAVTAFSPLIFILDRNTGLDELLRRTKEVCEQLDKDKTLLEKWNDSSNARQWYKNIANLYSSTERHSMSQVKEINKKGVYRIAHNYEPITKETPGQSVQLQYFNKQKKERYKILDELHDLNSKLMLIAGKKEKNFQEVSQFSDLLTAVENLADVHSKLIQSGCMLFENWRAEIEYRKLGKEQGNEQRLSLCVSFEEKPFKRRVTLDDISKITDVLADTLDSWKKHIFQKRQEYYYLNEYSITQITELCRELAKAINRGNLPDHIYMLLKSVTEDLTVNQIQEAISKATKNDDDDDDEDPWDEDQAIEEDSSNKSEQMMKAVKALVNREHFSEKVSKAAVKAEGYGDLAACVNWVIMYEDDQDLVEKLQDQFDEEIDFSHDMTSGKVVHSAVHKRSNKTLKDVINDLSSSPDLQNDIVSFVKTVCRAYSSETKMMSLQDYLSIDHLGRFLELVRVHNKSKLKREMPAELRRARPNVILSARESILSTALSIYMHCEDQPLPSQSEVLICSPQTTSDMVERFFMRALYKRKGIDDVTPIFCLANAQELLPNVSQKAETIFMKVSQESDLNTDFQLVVITSERQHYLTICMEKDIVDYNIKAMPLENLQNYVTKHLKVEQSEKSASKIDVDHASVRLVFSNRAGVGKSLHVKRSKDRLKTEGPKNCHNSTIRCLQRSFDSDGMIKKLHRDDILNEDAHLIHIDITPAVKEELEDFAFKLIVLGYIEGNSGRIWHRHAKHYYMIEFTEFSTSKTSLPAQHIFNLIPRILCVGPAEITDYQELMQSKAPSNKTSFEIGMDETEFKSGTYQRPYQYLKAYANGEDLDRFMFDKGNYGTTQMCIKTLLQYCSVKNPSWSQLHHFAQFLNIQLESCEKSSFCSYQDEDEEDEDDYELRGLKKLAIHFMIKMAQDLATPSLNIADKSQRDVSPDEDLIEKHETRRKWEESSHPFVFFNASDRGDETMTFVNVNIDQHGNLWDDKGHLIKKKMVSEDLVAALTGNGVPLEIPFEKYSRTQKLNELCKVIGVETPEADPDPTYELTSDNALKILAIYMRFRCNIPVILMGETGCGKTRMLDFISKLSKGGNGNVKNMYVLKVHGGTNVKDIFKVVENARQVSRENKEKYNVDTILFFDEANTTEAIYAIKEVMCDMSLNGESFKDNNLKIAAACNPYKRLSEESVRRLEASGLGYRFKDSKSIECFGNVPMRALVYRVVPLPPSIQPYIWDFGQINDDVEKLYIRQMALKTLAVLGGRGADKRFMPDRESFITALCQAQSYMKSRNDECRYVSLRDVERCMLAFEWFMMHAEVLTTMISTLNSDHLKNMVPENLFAIVQTLGLCYHASLDDRKAFRDHMVETSLKQYGVTEATFHETIVACQQVFLEGIRKDKTIACNEALRENVFMIAVCLEIGIPLYIIGKPGSSKSLAKTIIDSNMHGENSCSPLFKLLKQVQIISYQCSQYTDAEGIRSVFNQCTQLQSRQDAYSFTSCVVLDEIGLAEDSPKMPLKILHPLLENGFVSDTAINDDTPIHKVGFVGISNWSLDPAKMNRGLFVNRGFPDKADLVHTTEGIFAEKLKKWRPLVEILTDIYLKIYNAQTKEYFGLRDFYSLMKMIQSALDRNGTITMKDVGHALYRNFASGGYFNKDLLQKAIEHFQEHIKRQEPPLVADLDFIKPSTQDLLHANISEKNTCRNLLLLTNEYSVFYLLDLVFKREDFEVVFGSSFPQDHNYALKCRNINRIKVAMETGTTVVMVNMAEIHESLYDALNQHYVSFGGKHFVDLGLGCHRVKCRVHENFKLIMIEEKSIVYERYPIPLVNRLEKHVFDSLSLLNQNQAKHKDDLKKWVDIFATSHKDFTEHDAFIGYNSDTESSVAIAMEKEDPLKVPQTKLLKSATTDAVVRLTANKEMSYNDIKGLQEEYFVEQHHDTLVGLLKASLQEMKKDKLQEKRFEITSFSSVLNESDRKMLLEKLDLQNSDLMVIQLKNFQSENEYLEKLDEFFRRCKLKKKKHAVKKNPGILLIQCSQAHKHDNLIACAKYSLFNKMNNIMKSKEPMRQILVAFVLLTERPNALLQQSEEVLVLQHDKEAEIVYVDEIRPNMEIIGPASQFFNMSLQQVYEKGLKEMNYRKEKEGNEDEVTDEDDEFFIDLPGLLQDCTCEALGKIEDTANKDRLTKRIRILNDLFAAEGGYVAFQKMIVERLIQLCVEMERETGKDESENWLLKEACSKESLQVGGTFRKTIWLALKKNTARFLAYIISIIDENNNLDLVARLSSDEDSGDRKWIQHLWIELLGVCHLSWKKLKNVEKFTVENKHPNVANFEFPFSFEILRDLGHKTALQDAGDGGINRSPQAISFRSRAILGRVVENQTALRGFIKDMVRMNYHPGTSGNSSNEEITLIADIVFKFSSAKYAEWKLEDDFNPGDFYTKFYRVFKEIKKYLDIVARLFAVTSCQFGKEMATKISDQDLKGNDWVVGFTKRLFESFLKQLQDDSKNLSNEEMCLSWKKQATAAKSIFHALKSLDNTSVSIAEKWKPLSLVLLFLNQLLPSVPEKSNLFQNYLNVMFSQAKLLCRGPIAKGIRTMGFLKLLCSVLARAYDEIKLRLMLEWNDVTCKVCGNKMQEPVKLECGHFLCKECLKYSVKCPICSDKISKDFIPEKVHLTDQKKELSNFKSNCTSFFLTYLSEFCLDSCIDTDIPETLLSNFLLDHGGGRLKIDALDLNLNMRSHVFSLLQTQTQDKNFHIPLENNNELSVVAMTSFERTVNKKERDDEQVYLERTQMDIEDIWESIQSEGWTSSMLEMVSKIRSVLRLVLPYLHGRNVDSKEMRELKETVRSIITSDKSDTLKNYLTKLGCAKFGSEWFTNFLKSKSRRDLVPSYLSKIDVGGNIDFWILMGEIYRENKKTLRLARNQKAHIEKILKSVAERDPTEKNEQCKYLQYALVCIDFIIKSEKNFAADFAMLDDCKITCNLSQDVLPLLQFWNVSRRLGDQRQMWLFQLVVVSIAVIHRHFNKFSDLLSIIRSPKEFDTLFLPTMPELLYFAIPEEFRKVGNNNYGVDFNEIYECPNGHFYTIGDCTRAVGSANCLECGAIIGGVGYNKPAEGNRRVNIDEKTQAGYKLYTKDKHVDDPDERIPKHAVAVIRFMLHSGILIGLLHDETAHTSIPQGGTLKETLNFLVRQLWKDVGKLQNTLGKNMDDTFNFFHQIFLHMLNLTDEEIDRNDDAENSCTTAWRSTADRKKWERGFCNCFLSGNCFQSIDEKINQGWTEMNDEEDLCSAVFYRLVHDLPTMEEEQQQTAATTWTNPIFWQQIEHPSIPNFKCFMRGSDPNRGRVLRLILEKTDLTLLKYLYPVVKLQSILVKRYKHDLDMDRAEKMTLAEAKKDTHNDNTTRELFDQYKEAWDEIHRKLVRKIDRKNRYRKYFVVMREDRVPVGIALPSARGCGKCAKLLSEFLIDIQNDFLAECSKHTDCKFEEIDLADIATADLPKDVVVNINLERDFLSKIQMHTKYDRQETEKGVFHSMSYNIDALEKEVQETQVLRKKFLRKETLPCMQYKQDVGIGPEWQKLRENIKQEPLPAKIVRVAKCRNLRRCAHPCTCHWIFVKAYHR